MRPMYQDPSSSSTLSQIVITSRKQSLGQGNVFTRICYSVHRVEGVSVRGGLSPPPHTLDRETPWTETPLYGKERVVRILLECILVHDCTRRVHQCSKTRDRASHREQEQF